MALLELLTSSPGTGKTDYCIELFKSKILQSKSGIDSRSFFILPNREHAERIQNLILKKDVPGLFNAHILTINDFAARLLGATAGTPPTDTIRKGVLKDILEGKAMDSEPLKFSYFDSVKELAGFHELLVDTLKEFKANLLTIKEFEKLSQKLLTMPAFRSKFRDFSVLVKNYEAGLKALDLSEPEDDIGRLLRQNPHGDPADLVIFDGFYDFTRAQRYLIRAIARWSSHTIVTLTMDARGSARRSVFEYPVRTRDFLLEAGFEEAKGLFKKNYRTQEPALLHLEKNIFSVKPAVYEDPQESLLILEASDIRGEIIQIAREIKRLYRETGAHYSDFCVILRSLSGYEKIIDAVFTDLGVPVYVHERKKLIEHGFTTLLYRLFRLFEENWKREDLFYLLKSSYLSENFDWKEVLSLESLAVRENVIEGKEKWIGLLRHEAISPEAKRMLQWALDLESDFLNVKDAREFSARLLAWVKCFHTPSLTPRNIDEAVEQACYETIESILQNLRRYYEKTRHRPFSALSFLRETRESFETALFSLKPKGKNRVQVYDVVMALPKEYKVVFMAGLLEKVFPQEIREDALFKDEERRVINQKGVVLEERQWRSAGERYFFYMGLARAKNRLYLSYPLNDSEGRPALPSFFVEEVKKCFHRLPVMVSGGEKQETTVERWETEEDVSKGLAQILFRKDQLESASLAGLIPILNEWMCEKSFREVVRFGLSDGKAVIRDPKVREFFKSISGPFSATRLETYATCAFKYFAGKVLFLEESLEGREAVVMGSMLHETLEEFYKGLSKEARSSGSFLEDEPGMKMKLRTILEKRMKEGLFRNEPLYRQRIYLDSMRNALDIFIKAERKLFHGRELVPTFFELAFGNGDKESLDSLKIEDPSGNILVQGKIDRIDVSKDGKKALVIDYKRSSREFRMNERLSEGLELQLPIYLLAVKRLLNLEPIGAELRILRDGGSEGFYTEVSGDVLKTVAARKLRSPEEFEHILSDTESLIRQYLKRLRAADVSVRSKTCRYCRYDSVCRFEKWRIIYSKNNEEK